ncbi:MAG: hypothetical protein ACKO7A_07580 [Microcystis sp.]
MDKGFGYYGMYVWGEVQSYHYQQGIPVTLGGQYHQIGFNQWL